MYVSVSIPLAHITHLLLNNTQGAFGNRTLSDLSGFFSDDGALI